MKTGLVITAACIALGACSALQGQRVTFTGVAHKPIGEAADCLYAGLEETHGSGFLKKVDLLSQGAAYIEYAPDGIKFWRYSLK